LYEKWLQGVKGNLTLKVRFVIHAMNTDLVVIPRGMNSQLRFLDAVVKKPFKDYLKQLYSEWLLAGDHILTPTGKIKKCSVALLCQCIETS
jgi:hypothetical protein